MGFSHSTCLPAAAARTVNSRCMAVGQADVNCVHIFVFAEFVKGLVAVNRALRNAVAGGPLLALGVAVAGDQRRDLRSFGLEAGSAKDVGDGAKADEGIADGLAGLRSGLGQQWGRAGSKSGERQGREPVKLAAVHALHSTLRGAADAIGKGTPECAGP